MIEGFEADAVIADKGHDADCLADTMVESGAEVVIPPKRNRKVQRSCDKHLYRERNAVERFFGKLKHFRRVTTRYDTLLAKFMDFVKLAAIAIWIKKLNRHHALALECC